MLVDMTKPPRTRRAGHRASPLGLVLLALLGALPTWAAAPAQRWLDRPAPDFVLRDAQGVAHRLSESRAEVVLLSFWNPGCLRCELQTPALAQLQKVYAPAGLAVLSVGIDATADRLRDVASGLPAGMTGVLDVGGQVAKRYGVGRLPLLLLLDRSGRVRAVFEDYRLGDEAAYLARIKPLLDE